MDMLYHAEYGKGLSLGGTIVFPFSFVVNHLDFLVQRN